MTTENNLCFARGVRIIFFLQLFSTVAFSMIFSLLVLYCLFKLHLPQHVAYNLVAAYNALGYATAIFGGYIAERFLGYRFTILVSAIMGCAGMMVLTLPTLTALHWGLALFALASGMMIPSLFVLLGRLYTLDHTHRESSFVIAYVGMDVGTFLAAVSSGYISTFLNYAVAFAIGALCHLIMLGLFLKYKKIYARPQKKSFSSSYLKQSRIRGLLLILGMLFIIVLLLSHAATCNYLLLLLGAASVAFIIYFACKEKGKYRGKLFLFLALLCISTLFDALYFLSPSTLTVFTQFNVDRHCFGTEIPTATYSALNPLFVIILGPLLSGIWLRLHRQGKTISAPTKFAWGIMLMGAGYLILMYATAHTNAKGYTSSTWIIVSYLLQTLGELFISPTGYAIVGSLVPTYLEGTMMGISQFSTGVAGAFSGFISNWVSPPSQTLSLNASNYWYHNAFGYLGIISVIIGLIALTLAPYLKKLDVLEGKPQETVLEEGLMTSQTA